MKKIEIIEFLNENNVNYDKDLSYHKLLKVYNDYLIEREKFETEEVIIKKELTQSEQFELYRKKLYKKIYILMGELQGKSNCNQKQLADMFRLYNSYYKRADSPSCSPCVARVFNTLKKLVKKNGIQI